MPMTKLPAQRKEYMPKTTKIDHTSVLEMALVGYELQRNRIEAAIAEIHAELGQDGPSRSISTATASAEPKATGKKRFSAAARKRMAAAQKKRWQLLKAKKAEAAIPKHKMAAKRKKATAAAPARKPLVQVKAAKKVARKVVKAAPKPKMKTAAPRPKEGAAEAPKAAVETFAAPVQVATEPTPATA